MYTEAAKLEDETDEEKQDEEEQGGLFATSIGPQERRRLMVASMSPEDIVSKALCILSYRIVSDQIGSCCSHYGT